MLTITNDADRFGLANYTNLEDELADQLQGYLITRPIDQLTLEARKRLIAFEELDLVPVSILLCVTLIFEAGDILGGEQSGFKMISVSNCIPKFWMKLYWKLRNKNLIIYLQ